MNKTYYVVTSDGLHISGYIDGGSTEGGTPVTITPEQELDFLNNFIWYKLDGVGGVVKMEEEEFYTQYPQMRPKTTKELFEELASEVNSLKNELDNVYLTLSRISEKF